jgi:hypothetical protein
MPIVIGADGCCTCDRCAPYRKSIIATIQYLNELVHAAPTDVSGRTLTVFDSAAAPNISLNAYVQRFVHHHRYFEWPVLTVALVYIGRIQSISESHQITMYNIHRIVCTAFVIAFKYTLDHVYDNKVMARIGGIDTTRELNLMEIYCLKAIKYNIHVTHREFKDSARYFGHKSPQCTSNKC